MEIDREEQSAQTAFLEYKQSLYYDIAKRSVDVIFSLFLLLFLIPLFLLIACCIKWSDPKGEVFFRQERVGLNERRFQMFKFRTMCSDAEEKLVEILEMNEMDGAMFKVKNDPRVTSVGKVLRKFSLDELPQLINVLKGEMSLVGPRPCLNREILEYTAYHKQRLLVKPGMTGLWQVSGRNSLTFEQMIELDLVYVQRLSILNDLRILLRTILVVCKPEHAY